MPVFFDIWQVTLNRTPQWNPTPKEDLLLQKPGDFAAGAFSVPSNTSTFAPEHITPVQSSRSVMPVLTTTISFTALKLLPVKYQTHSAFFHCWSLPTPGFFIAVLRVLSQAGLSTRGYQLGRRPLSEQTSKAYIKTSPLASPALAFQELYQRYHLHGFVSKSLCYCKLWIRI